jgi:O-antigen ligase
MKRFQELYLRILDWNWYLIFLFLPFTGLSLLASIAGSMVAPPSSIFVFLLAAIWLIPYILKKGQIPRQTLPLIAFGLVALISTTLALFGNSPEFNSISANRQIIKGVITLIIGLGTYIVIASFPRRASQIELALKIINWVGFAILGWTAIRAGFWYLTGSYPHLVEKLQQFFSTGFLETGRALGFTMEPSWLAHQLNMLFLPLWLAATLQRSTVHSRKVLGFSFENALLIGGIITLLLTLSRAGIAAFLLVLGFVFLVLNQRLVKWMEQRVSTRGDADRRHSKFRRKFPKAIIYISLILVYLILIFGVAFLLTRLDARMATLFNFDISDPNAILKYANDLKFGERVAYWSAGWNIFNDHPVMGVGLGLAGFSIPSHLPPYSWMMVEVRNIAYRSDMLFNIKSIWVRILAETGLVGFSAFLGWLFTIFNSTRFLQKQKNPLLNTMGWAGLFMLIGFILDGFNVDSFTLPYIWVLTGLVTATCIISSSTDLSRKKV